MSVFDDMVAILSQINEKLGDNAGNKAGAVLNPQAQPKPKEDSFKDNKNYNELVRGFKDALNSVPIFSKIAAALTGLSPVLRDIVGGGVLLKASKYLEAQVDKLDILDKAFKSVTGKGVKDANVPYASDPDFLSEVSDKQKSLMAILAMYHDSGMAVEDAYKNGGPKNPLNEIMLKFHDLLQQAEHPGVYKAKQVTGFAEWEKLFDNVKEGLKNLAFPMKYAGKGIFNFYKGVIGSTIGGSGKPMGEVFRSLFGDLGFAFKNTNLTGGMGPVSLMGLLKLPTLLISIGAGLIKLGKSIADAQRSISGYSGSMAVAFAMSDVRGMFRDMHQANATAEATAKFLDAWNDMADKFQPIKEQLINGFLELATALTKLVTGIMEIYNSLPEWAKRTVIGILTLGGSELKKFKEEIAKEQAVAEGKGLDHSNRVKQAEEGLRHGDKETYEAGMKKLLDHKAELQAQMDAITGEEKENIWGEKVNVYQKLKARSEDKSFFGGFNGPDEMDRWSVIKQNLDRLNADMMQTDTGIQAMKNLESQLKENPSLIEKDKLTPEKKQELEKNNQFSNAMAAVKKAADEAWTFYNKGGEGAGDFMLSAATWNYDPDHPRASEANQGLWDAGVARMRHGAK